MRLNEHLKLSHTHDGRTQIAPDRVAFCATGHNIRNLKIMKLTLEKAEIPDLTFDELVRHLRYSKITPDEYTGLLTSLKEELASREPTIDYKCKNCGNTHYEEHQVKSIWRWFQCFFQS